MAPLPELRDDLVDLVVHRRDTHRFHPEVLLPWWRPCTVKALLVTDGGLDFGDGDFGLSAFVTSLVNDQRSYVRFEITVAHLRTDVSDAQVMVGNPGIARSIKGFRFDVASHFTSTMYDEVWLFGIETNYGYQPYYGPRAVAANGYPTDRLKDSELDRLTAHMNRGGGVFATGDHGSLGHGLGSAIDRVRSMRHWEDFGAGEVSMAGPRRNDSNHIGHDAGSQFSDQSDDIPQPLDLKLYSSWAGILREARYPHPVLCSPLGRIDVFPDHPHEGECMVPSSLTTSCRDGSDEYPPATDGTGRVEPEIIAWGHVPAGNVASSHGSLKQPTVAHRFGLLSAYDGHRAAVGRVVCDSTWHHFVNVNLIGIFEGGGFDDFGRAGEDASKHTGFLASAAGQAVLAKIRHYYVNVGVWIAPAERIACMNSRLWWDLLWSDRLVEATLMDPAHRFEDIHLVDLWHIGVQARDVLGRRAGACQTLHLVLPWLREIYLELVPHIDPWGPWLPPGKPGGPRPPEPPLPWINHEQLLDLALGGALMALREHYPYPTKAGLEFDERAEAIVRKGMAAALDRGLGELTGEMRRWSKLGSVGRERLGELARAELPAGSKPAKTTKRTSKATKTAKATKAAKATRGKA